MKTLVALLLLAILSWSPPVSAKYCRTGSNDMILCRFTDNTGRPHDATIAISYTKQGWSMMIAVFLKKDWIMLEGDGKIEMEDTFQDLSYVKTHRDIADNGKLMEAAVFLVSEQLLMDIENAGGMIKFHLPSTDAGEQEIKFRALRFSNLDEFIEETKATLDAR